jgi:hypothetical protein
MLMGIPKLEKLPGFEAVIEVPGGDSILLRLPIPLLYVLL